MTTNLDIVRPDDQITTPCDLRFFSIKNRCQYAEKTLKNQRNWLLAVIEIILLFHSIFALYNFSL